MLNMPAMSWAQTKPFRSHCASCRHVPERFPESGDLPFQTVAYGEPYPPWCATVAVSILPGPVSNGKILHTVVIRNLMAFNSGTMFVTWWPCAGWQSAGGSRSGLCSLVSGSLSRHVGLGAWQVLAALEAVQFELQERETEVQNHFPLFSLFFTFRRGMLPACSDRQATCGSCRCGFSKVTSSIFRPFGICVRGRSARWLRGRAPSLGKCSETYWISSCLCLHQRHPFVSQMFICASLCICMWMCAYASTHHKVHVRSLSSPPLTK